MAIPICHLLVLGSACFNPLLYGWLNDNFRREFIKALCCCAPCPAVVRGATAAAADTRTVNGARSAMGPSVVGGGGGGGARPARRGRRRPSNDIELEPRDHHHDHHVQFADDRHTQQPTADKPTANCPDQLVSLVDK